MKQCTEAMNLSPGYFSDWLISETGKSVQEQIHYFLPERAKHLLVNSNLSIGEIAWEPVFEYTRSFSKLFRKKVGVAPSGYRGN